MSFKKIYGHEKQIAILQASALRNRVPHAYLFCGMKGIGKKTVADVFAKALNCTGQASIQRRPSAEDAENAAGQTSSDRFDSCDCCSSCLKTDRKNHPDVITIETDRQFIKVNEIRDLQDQMKFAPLEGKKRIFIMIDADKMNIYSANALLKTLEEPSRHNLLILITSSPHLLPMTILSRCQQLRFRPLLADTIATFLRARLSLDTERACLIASSSGGSIGKALEMNEDSSLAVRDETLSMISKNHMKEPLGFLSSIQGFGQEREGISDRLNVLLTGYRDALIYKETGEDHFLINQGHADIIKSVSRELSGRDILYNIRTVDWAMRAIDQNANKQLTLEAMMFRLIRYSDSELR